MRVMAVAAIEIEIATAIAFRGAAGGRMAARATRTWANRSPPTPARISIRVNEWTGRHPSGTPISAAPNHVFTTLASRTRRGALSRGAPQSHDPHGDHSIQISSRVVDDGTSTGSSRGISRVRSRLAGIAR